MVSSKLTYNVKKRQYTKIIIKNRHTTLKIKMVDDVCPLPGAFQICPLFLLLPPHVQIKDKLLNCVSWPTWISCKSSSWGGACHTQALCACCCCFWPWTSCHNPCRQKPGHCSTGKILENTWKACGRLYKGEPFLFLGFSTHTYPIQQQ